MPKPIHNYATDSGVDLVKNMIDSVRRDFAEGNARLPSDAMMFFDMLEQQIVQTLMDLHNKAKLGEIHLDYPLRLSITDYEPDYTMHKLPRHLRIGFLATTGDPVHWGHVLRALTDAEEFQLDTVILQVIGDHPHKPFKHAKVHRHTIAHLVAEMFYPLIRYCPLGYDNLSIGEQNAAEFLMLNAKTEIDLFFLAGDDAAAQAIRNIDACNRLLEGVRNEIKPMKMYVIVSRYTVENVYPRGSLPDWIICRTELSQRLPECRGMRISSQLFRTYPELPLLPRRALNYIHRHGLYQSVKGKVDPSLLESVVILSFLPPGLHRLIAEELTDTVELPALIPHGRSLTTGTFGAKRVTLLAAAGKETSILPIMERPEVRIVLGIGLCGSLQSWLMPGAIVLPSTAVRGDGITSYWVDPRLPPTPDFKLLHALLKGAESLGLHPNVGPLYTTASLAHEKQIAAGFAPFGVLGVEMELSLHYTLAALHKKIAASIYVVSDNVILGNDILQTGITETPVLRHAVKAAIATMANAISSYVNGERGESCRDNE
jgi:purine-nucleoside phosphorylase/nicotinic acid mononucleotide adenylyltransferase